MNQGESSRDEVSYSMAFDSQNFRNLRRSGDSDDSDENYGEEGSSSQQNELQSQIEMVRLVSEYANFNDQFK